LIVGLAVCGFGFLLLLKPAQYAATTRIKVEIEPQVSNFWSDYSYDPYFIQTEFEMLQSQVVLFGVITNLNLNEVWGKKYSHRETLKTTETMKIIKTRMRLATVRNTRLIAITFFSDDPNEAAQVANAIAKAYEDYRINSVKESTKKGIAVLQQDYQEEEKQISVLQTNVEQLRQQFGIQDSRATNHLSEQQPYWDAKHNLEQMIKLHQLLGEKLEVEKLDLSIPKSQMVQITDPAEPPKSPVGPNRSLGVCLIVAGLLSMVAGWLLLKPSGQKTD
jgi:uncharacterized protein involved in exopolysaccharide biosynthesis